MLHIANDQIGNRIMFTQVNMSFLELVSLGMYALGIPCLFRRYVCISFVGSFSRRS